MPGPLKKTRHLPKIPPMKKEIVHVGCSSHSTGDWLETFYPKGLPRSQWFGFYASHFESYELNATFYKFPTVRTLENWHNRTPEGFSFSVKAPKIITHVKKFENCGPEIETFYRTCSQGLRDKLKCILFQLPPGFGYTRERLLLIAGQLDKSYRNVVEFRNAGWWIPEVFETFSEAGITFCCPSYPKLPSEIISTASLGYVRLHGNPKLFYSEYPREELEKIWEQVQEQKFAEVFIFFNNTASASGITNALEMKSIARVKKEGS